jgi:hypothetical protein
MHRKVLSTGQAAVVAEVGAVSGTSLTLSALTGWRREAR